MARLLLTSTQRIGPGSASRSQSTQQARRKSSGVRDGGRSISLGRTGRSKQLWVSLGNLTEPKRIGGQQNDIALKPRSGVLYQKKSLVITSKLIVHYLSAARTAVVTATASSGQSPTGWGAQCRWVHTAPPPCICRKLCATLRTAVAAISGEITPTSILDFL